MLTEEGLQFILRITDYFHGHYEDLNWGRRHINQILIYLSVHTLAEGIADKETRAAIQIPIEKGMAGLAQKIASTPDPISPKMKGVVRNNKIRLTNMK